MIAAEFPSRSPTVESIWARAILSLGTFSAYAGRGRRPALSPGKHLSSRPFLLGITGGAVLAPRPGALNPRDRPGTAGGSDSGPRGPAPCPGARGEQGAGEP